MTVSFQIGGDLLNGKRGTLVPEVFLEFSSFREEANTSREVPPLPLRGSLAALSCGERSREEKIQEKHLQPAAG